MSGAQTFLGRNPVYILVKKQFCPDEGCLHVFRRKHGVAAQRFAFACSGLCDRLGTRRVCCSAQGRNPDCGAESRPGAGEGRRARCQGLEARLEGSLRVHGESQRNPGSCACGPALALLSSGQIEKKAQPVRRACLRQAGSGCSAWFIQLSLTPTPPHS